MKEEFLMCLTKRSAAITIFDLPKATGMILVHLLNGH